MRKIIIAGLEKEVIELAESLPDVVILGVLDPQSDVDTLGFPYLGNDDSWEKVKRLYSDARIAISLDTPSLKQRLVGYFGVETLASLVSANSHTSSRAVLAAGHIVQHGARISPRVSIGIACKINTDAVVHHDCVIGNFCTLAPGSRLLGQVSLGDLVFVGAGAIVLPKVSIGSNCTIGSGAVVVKDVPDDCTVVGVPAYPIQARRSL